MNGLRRNLGAIGMGIILALALTGCFHELGEDAAGSPTEAAIVVEDATLAPGETTDVRIRAQEIPQGLQAIEVSGRAGDFLSFDAQVVQLKDVESVSPFALDAVNVDNATGRVSFIARVPADGTFPVNSDVLTLSFDAVGEAGTNTALQLEVTNLVNGNRASVSNAQVESGDLSIR